MLNARNRRGYERDAQDVAYAMSQYWNRVDLNRIPEQEMNDLARRFPAVAPSWHKLRQKYGMCVLSLALALKVRGADPTQVMTHEHGKSSIPEDGRPFLILYLYI